MKPDLIEFRIKLKLVYRDSDNPAYYRRIIANVTKLFVFVTDATPDAVSKKSAISLAQDNFPYKILCR